MCWEQNINNKQFYIRKVGTKTHICVHPCTETSRSKCRLYFFACSGGKFMQQFSFLILSFNWVFHNMLFSDHFSDKEVELNFSVFRENYNQNKILYRNTVTSISKYKIIDWSCILHHLSGISFTTFVLIYFKVFP